MDSALNNLKWLCAMVKAMGCGIVVSGIVVSSNSCCTIMFTFGQILLGKF